MRSFVRVEIPINSVVLIITKKISISFQNIYYMQFYNLWSDYITDITLHTIWLKMIIRRTILAYVGHLNTVTPKWFRFTTQPFIIWKRHPTGIRHTSRKRVMYIDFVDYRARICMSAYHPGRLFISGQTILGTTCGRSERWGYSVALCLNKVFPEMTATLSEKFRNLALR